MPNFLNRKKQLAALVSACAAFAVVVNLCDQVTANALALVLLSAVALVSKDDE